MYVLDTNVVSELRKAAKANASVRAWASSVSVNAMYLSAVTVLELETGVLLAERRDPPQGSVLRQWLDTQVLPTFSRRVLSFDSVVARRCAHLHVPDPRSERDAMIAATAIIHGMSVVTRNVSDFAPTGVHIVDPWTTARP